MASHRCASDWHDVPVKEGVQLHVYDPAVFTHVPPLWQRLEPPYTVHSSMSVSQYVPLYPGAHVHVKPPAELLQVAPFLHQSGVAHSLMSVAHVVPV